MDLTNWTKDIVDKAQNTESYPVAIVSYKRGYKAPSIQLMKDAHIKTFLFIYDFDYDNYKLAENDYITHEFCPDFEGGLNSKRNYVIKRMRELGYNKFFMLDDDVTKLYYTTHGQTAKGDYKAQKINIDTDTFFKTWTYELQNLDFTATMSGVSSEMSSWTQDLRKHEETKSTGRICQIVYIDSEEFDKHNIKYEEQYSWEDFDVEMQVFAKQGKLAVIPWLAYGCSTMTPNVRKTLGGEGITSYIWTRKSMRLYQKWGDYVGFKNDKGELNSTFSWSKIKKDMGNFTISYNLTWWPYFNKEKTPDNPHGLDWEGFSNLFNRENCVQ